jgi:putative endonuclease
MFYTYILFSTTKGIYYKGSTDNLIKRIVSHNSGLVNYTSKYLPWILVHYEIFETRAEAMKREKFFKTGKGRALIKELIAQGKNNTNL